MKTVVIKYGGAAMQSPELVERIMQDIAQLKLLGMCVVVVHGGGPEISKWCQKMGITPRFIDGLRVTNEETMQIVQMVLMGKINKALVAHLNQKGAKAVGLSGQDGNFLSATKFTHPSGIDLGFVGQVAEVNPEILKTLMQAGYIPVIAPLAASPQPLGFNVNADSVASHIARALKADHLIFLTDVPGILEDPQNVRTKMDTIKGHEIEALMASDKLSGGMIPKIEGALAALKEGVKEVHILDGRVANSLLLHFQGLEPVGTRFSINSKL